MNKTIKIIDLIKMIDDTYYQDKLPKEVKYNGVKYLCCDYDYPIKYINAGGVSLMQELHSNNDEVEILEDNDKLEKTEKLTPFEAPFLKDNKVDIRFRLLIEQQNKIIDHISKIEKKLEGDK